jgi:signal transduction histidine kinase
VRLSDGDHFLAFTDEIAPRRYVAFSLRPEVLRTMARTAYERRTPFPGQPIHARSRLISGDVFIHIAQGDLELLKTRGHFDPALGVRFTVPQRYGDLLAGSIVETSFTAAALPEIVTGGLPTSGVWFAVLMLFSSALVLVAVGLIMHRERQLEHMRADFISAVSHELRTPLTQIRMFSETLLRNRVRSESERQRSLQIVNQETTRLSHLVDNILLLSRRERGILALCFEETDIRDLIRQTLDAFEPMIASRRARITVNAPEPVIAFVDPGAFKQVLINFLDNAVKYGPSAQTIVVTATTSAGQIRIDVDDEGPGIPPSDRAAVWRKFFRLPRDRETDRAGSGIGLAVSAGIVERHHGRYSISASPSGGARFTIEFPVHQDVPAADDDFDRRFFEELEPGTGH